MKKFNLQLIALRLLAYVIAAAGFAFLLVNVAAVLVNNNAETLRTIAAVIAVILAPFILLILISYFSK